MLRFGTQKNFSTCVERLTRVWGSFSSSSFFSFVFFFPSACSFLSAYAEKSRFSPAIFLLPHRQRARPAGLSFYFASSRMKKVKLTRTPSATCYGLCSRLEQPHLHRPIPLHPVEKSSSIESRKRRESNRISPWSAGLGHCPSFPPFPPDERPSSFSY